MPQFARPSGAICNVMILYNQSYSAADSQNISTIFSRLFSHKDFMVLGNQRSQGICPPEDLWMRGYVLKVQRREHVDTVRAVSH